MIYLDYTPTEFIIEALADGGIIGKPTRKRKLRGLAAPYNIVATSGGASGPVKVRLLPGSLPTDGPNPAVTKYHDPTKLVGVVTERTDTPTGMNFTAFIFDTADGNDALTEAEAKVLTGVSVGLNPTKWHYDGGQVMNVEACEWGELTLTTFNQAWPTARIYDIAATIPQTAPNLGNNQNQPNQETPPMETVIAPTAPTVEQIEAHTAALTANTAALTANATTPTPLLFAEPKRNYRMPSAAEWIAAFHIGGETFKKIQLAYTFAANANNANPFQVQAAVGDILTTDTPGLLPVPIIGPVFDGMNWVRPVVNAIGVRPMPETHSKTFIRPSITAHTSTGVTAEMAAVSKATMTVAGTVITKQKLAGGVTISYEDLDFTSPAAIQIVLNDMANIYMDGTDIVATAAVLAAATTSGVWDLTVADLITSVFAAAVDSMGSGATKTNRLPTHMLVSTDTWAKLAALTDLDGRLQFPNLMGGLQGFNALGTASATSVDGGNVLGLRLVVDANFAVKTMVILDREAFEIYEERRGQVMTENAGNLSRDISLYGYVATHAALPQAIRKITQV